LIITFICLLIAGAIGVLSLARRSSEIPAWHMNLLKIQNAKVTWMRGYNKTENDTPTWQDLNQYLEIYGITNGNGFAGGGTYTIGRIGDSPVCLLAGRKYSLPHTEMGLGW